MDLLIGVMENAFPVINIHLATIIITPRPEPSEDTQMRKSCDKMRFPVKKK